MASQFEAVDVVRGDATGLLIPAHGDAMRALGPEWLTQAFHHFGSLPLDNRVARVVDIAACPGGSTGHKVFLTLAYARPDPALHTELFVKFSRDFTDPLRDRMRHEMESEIAFGAISRQPDFPINVPVAYFADYQRDTGTGVLITERIAFGEGGIEPHHAKFHEDELGDPLDYYRVLVRSLARLAAAHRAGRLSPDIDTRFPYDPAQAAASDKIPHDEPELRDLVARYGAFAARCPQLLPANIRSAAFLSKLDSDVGRFLKHEALIKRFLQSDPQMIALCHWNAQIDNGWFWRDATGQLRCGLLDWGRVGQLNVAFALWGCLAGAPYAIWDREFHPLLELFSQELAAHGGPGLRADDLSLHLQMYVAMMALAWLLEAPARIFIAMPDADKASGPDDPAFHANETARGFLRVFASVLYIWETLDFGASLDRVLSRMGEPVAARAAGAR